jgi:hypothetical protein
MHNTFNSSTYGFILFPVSHAKSREDAWKTAHTIRRNHYAFHVNQQPHPLHFELPRQLVGSIFSSPNQNPEPLLHEQAAARLFDPAQHEFAAAADSAARKYLKLSPTELQDHYTHIHGIGSWENNIEPSMTTIFHKPVSALQLVKIGADMGTWARQHGILVFSPFADGREQLLHMRVKTHSPLIHKLSPGVVANISKRITNEFEKYRSVTDTDVAGNPVTSALIPGRTYLPDTTGHTDILAWVPPWERDPEKIHHAFQQIAHNLNGKNVQYWNGRGILLGGTSPYSDEEASHMDDKTKREQALSNYSRVLQSPDTDLKNPEYTDPVKLARAPIPALSNLISKAVGGNPIARLSLSLALHKAGHTELANMVKRPTDFPPPGLGLDKVSSWVARGRDIPLTVGMHKHVGEGIHFRVSVHDNDGNALGHYFPQNHMDAQRVMNGFMPHADLVEHPVPQRSEPKGETSEDLINTRVTGKKLFARSPAKTGIVIRGVFYRPGKVIPNLVTRASTADVSDKPEPSKMAQSEESGDSSQQRFDPEEHPLSPPVASPAPSASLEDSESSASPSSASSSDSQFDEQGHPKTPDPDDLYSNLYGRPEETFVSVTPDDTYRRPGSKTHYQILQNDMGSNTSITTRYQAVDAGYVLGRTGVFKGKRVTSFWNPPTHADKVKAYVTAELASGSLHPTNDWISFYGNPNGMVQAGEFVKPPPENAPPVDLTKIKWNPEDLRKVHNDPRLKALILKHVAMKEKHPIQKKMEELGLSAPGRNWRYPLQEQNPGEPVRLARPNPLTLYNLCCRLRQLKMRKS